MCNKWCIDFSRKGLPLLSEGIKVLEVGSRDVNGSVRQVLAPIATQYIGVDIVDGLGVDELLDVANISARFEEESFDVVVNTEMLEHCFDWQNAIYEMLKVLKKNGLLILTTRSPGFELHDYPGDHWRFSQHDMQCIFQDVSELLAIDDDMTLGWPCGVGVIVRKICDSSRLKLWLETIKDFNVVTAESSSMGRLNCIERKVLFNQFSRNHACADILRKICNKESTILVVGNWEGVLLGEFFPITQYTSVDRVMSNQPVSTIQTQVTNNVISDIGDQIFDYVISIDTLEHIHPDQRNNFIDRLSGLARKGLILTFPAKDAGDAIGTDTWVNDVYNMAYGRNYPWLQEHFQNELPSLFKILDHLNVLNWQTVVTQNGHTPWLRKLLGFTLCALEDKALEPAIFEMSSYFNTELYKFDNLEPCYRQVVVATKDKIDLFYEDYDYDTSEAEKHWEHLEKRIIGFPSYCIKMSRESASAHNKEDINCVNSNKDLHDRGHILTRTEQGTVKASLTVSSKVVMQIKKLLKVI